MSKYTAEQVQQAACKFFKIKDAGDPRVMGVITAISLNTGLSPRQVEARIARLARGDVAGGNQHA